MSSTNSISPQPVDLASERLLQAKGVLGLLTADPDAQAFTASMRDVMASLWAVEALIDQAHEAVKAIRTPAAAGN